MLHAESWKNYKDNFREWLKQELELITEEECDLEYYYGALYSKPGIKPGEEEGKEEQDKYIDFLMQKAVVISKRDLIDDFYIPHGEPGAPAYPHDRFEGVLGLILTIDVRTAIDFFDFTEDVNDKILIQYRDKTVYLADDLSKKYKPTGKREKLLRDLFRSGDAAIDFMARHYEGNKHLAKKEIVTLQEQIRDKLDIINDVFLEREDVYVWNTDKYEIVFVPQ